MNGLLDKADQYLEKRAPGAGICDRTPHAVAGRPTTAGPGPARRHAARFIGLVAGLFLGVMPAVSAPPGSGPSGPPGPGGLLGIPIPPIPCDPPQRPLLGEVYTIQGRLTEQCLAQQPLGLVPIEAHVRIKAGIRTCDPNEPFAQTYDLEFLVDSGTTDADGRFSLTFTSGVLLARVSEDDSLFQQLVTILVVNPGGGGAMAQTIYASADASLTYTINHDFSTCLTDSTAIQVVNTSDDGVFGAEVFVNGTSYPERTGASGYVYITPPLSPGDTLVARARVYESHSERGAHGAGSNQDWKHRVYITSLPVEHDADGDNVTFTRETVSNPHATYQLELSRLNTVVGLHLLLSVEWDASNSELTADFEAGIEDASEYLFNATDGQFLIEQVEVYDDKVRWDQADWRVYADASLRAHVDWPRLHGFWGSGGWMHMSRSNGPRVYIHEFGHYGFKLGDEYTPRSPIGLPPNHFNGPQGQCAHGTTLNGPPFAPGEEKASCLMWSQWQTTKFCSDHPDNPHLNATGQGDQDCWSELAGYFQDGSSSVPRWLIRTPVDRGVILGEVPNIPVTDWLPHVSITDAYYPDLCQPLDFEWTVNGSPVRGAIVLSKRPGGCWITQGITGSDGRIDPFSGSNTRMTGIHVGDTVCAYYWAYSGDSWQMVSKRHTVTEDDRINASVALNLPHGQTSAAIQVLDLAREPFELSASLEPTGTQGEARIRVRSTASLPQSPQVSFSLSRDSQPRAIPMEYEAVTDSHVGLVDDLPDFVEAMTDVTAFDAAGQRATRVVDAIMGFVDPSEEAVLVSADGQLELIIPDDGVAAGSSVSLGSTLAPAPALAGDTTVVSGPFAILTVDSGDFARPAWLRIRLAFDDGVDFEQVFDAGTLRLLRYDEAAGQWIELDATYAPGVPIVETEISGPGSYALVADMVDPNARNVGSLPFDGGELNQAGSESESGRGRGTGVCGSGSAVMTPLMLACLGSRIHRRRRSHAVARS